MPDRSPSFSSHAMLIKRNRNKTTIHQTLSAHAQRSPFTHRPRNNVAFRAYSQFSPQLQDSSAQRAYLRQPVCYQSSDVDFWLRFAPRRIVTVKLIATWAIQARCHFCRRKNREQNVGVLKTEPVTVERKEKGACDCFNQLVGLKRARPVLRSNKSRARTERGDLPFAFGLLTYWPQGVRAKVGWVQAKDETATARGEYVNISF